ncbi:hypothetical protein Ancab_024372 [Ancistrocladus abbreviatus]
MLLPWKNTFFQTFMALVLLERFDIPNAKDIEVVKRISKVAGGKSGYNPYGQRHQAALGYLVTGLCESMNTKGLCSALVKCRAFRDTLDRFKDHIDQSPQKSYQLTNIESGEHFLHKELKSQILPWLVRKLSILKGLHPQGKTVLE